MTDGVSYGEVLAANLRAARARAGLGQELVAARMRALGFTHWRHQTVGAAEKGKRRLMAEEVQALAWALEGTIYDLVDPAEFAGRVEFPSGERLSAGEEVRLAFGSQVRAAPAAAAAAHDDPEETPVAAEMPAPGQGAVPAVLREARNLVSRIESLLEAAGDQEVLQFASGAVDRSLRRVQIELEELLAEPREDRLRGET